MQKKYEHVIMTVDIGRWIWIPILQLLEFRRTTHSKPSRTVYISEKKNVRVQVGIRACREEIKRIHEDMAQVEEKLNAER